MALTLALAALSLSITGLATRGRIRAACTILGCLCIIAAIAVGP